MPTIWTDQLTHKVGEYGEHEPPGEGAYGGNEWYSVEPPQTSWRDNALHNVAEYGGEEPIGEGSYGGQDWSRVL